MKKYANLKPKQLEAIKFVGFEITEITQQTPGDQNYRSVVIKDKHSDNELRFSMSSYSEFCIAGPVAQKLKTKYQITGKRGPVEVAGVFDTEAEAKKAGDDEGLNLSDFKIEPIQVTEDEQ